MWETKVWRFKDVASMPAARAKRDAWIERHGDNYQWEEIAVNNAYGLLVRKCRMIG